MVPFTTSRPGRHRRARDDPPLAPPAGPRLYVRELGRVPGEVGPVVVVFDEDRTRRARYPYRLTWMGEHGQEIGHGVLRDRPGAGRRGAGDLPRRPTAASCSPTRRGAWPTSGATPTTLSPRPRPRCCCWPRSTTRGSGSWCTWPRARRAGSSTRSRRGSTGRSCTCLWGPCPRNLAPEIRVMHVLAGHAKREIAKDYVW